MQGYPVVTMADADTAIGGDKPRESLADVGSGVWAHAPTPASADGFAQALASEQRAMCEILSAAPRPIQERLTPLIADLYTILRTPIFPKRGYRSVAEALVQTVARDENRVHLYGVLASPTAMTEMSSFTRCAAIFRQHGFLPHVELMLVQWENLVEIRHQDVASRGRAFARHVRAVAEAARQAGFMDAVIPVAIEVDAESAEILHPADFRDWALRVFGAAHEPRHADQALVRDVVWSTGFYRRQVSLSRLGEHQALLDLAIRRAIGQRVSVRHSSHLHPHDGAVAMLTSELHKRFLPCYGASLPIVNIDASARAGASGMAAVA